MNAFFKHLKSSEYINISNTSSLYHDELKYFNYSATVDTSYFKKMGYVIGINNKIGGGFSLQTKELALMKCVGEVIERLCQSCYQKSNIIYSSYNRLIKENTIALDPTNYIFKEDVKNAKFGWVKGFDLIEDRSVYIPAQLTYNNFLTNNNEIMLTAPISTGAAAGFSHMDCLLNGICEVIERDVNMTTYLNKIAFSPLNLMSVNGVANSYLQKCIRYNLTPYIFRQINDLEVPCFLTILIDETQLGPAIVVGSKVAPDIDHAILGSIEEALMGRMWVRSQIRDNGFCNNFHINRKEIDTHERTYLFWSGQEVCKLEYLTKNKKILFAYEPKKIDKKQVLRSLIRSLSKKNMKAYYVDVTLEYFKETGIHVYKIIIPTMQALYLDQTKPIYNMNRIKKVSDFYKKKQFKIYNFPHFFP